MTRGLPTLDWIDRTNCCTASAAAATATSRTTPPAQRVFTRDAALQRKATAEQEDEIERVRLALANTKESSEALGRAVQKSKEENRQLGVQLAVAKKLAIDWGAYARDRANRAAQLEAWAKEKQQATPGVFAGGAVIGGLLAAVLGAGGKGGKK
jgi:hypothetical protein